MMRQWGVRLGLPVVLIVLGSGCVSAPPRSAPRRMKTARAPQHAAIDSRCHLAPVAGDTRMIVTDDGRVVLIGVGLGIMESTDGGLAFDSVAAKSDFRWPSIATDGSRVWASWIESEPSLRAVVASVGQGLGGPVVVLTSRGMLIDTELLPLGGGELLLFVTDVDGPPNRNEATYTIRCLASNDGGLNWAPRSVAVAGPWGINIEDPRAFVRQDGAILLAFEWESVEGGASEIMIQRSGDGGRSWSSATVLWGGTVPADREPGGFARVRSDLWFVASTDVEHPGTSYAGAEISMIRSSDGGTTWTDPRTLIREPDQISMGVAVVDGAVILPSLRRYHNARERFLALYRVDPVGRWPVGCVGTGMFVGDFEGDPADGWSVTTP